MSEDGDLCFQPPRHLVEASSGDQQGTFPKGYLNDSQVFHPLSPSSLSNDYKISLPPSMETQIRKLKLSMEPWRELILQGNSILLWEKQWHSTALLAGTSAIFTIIWLCNPNVLTIISLLGLIITVADYLLPAVLSSVFKADTWTGEKQKQYEEICTNIILYKTKTELLVSSYCRMRVTNSKLYFGITIAALGFLTWLGGTIDNLFLTYLVVSFLIMLPGMQHHGMINKFSETCSKLFNDLVENAKAKVGQKKVQ